MIKKKLMRITTTLVLLLALLMGIAANAAGDNVYTNTRLLADNFEYINSVAWGSDTGRTESYAVRMIGSGDAYPIVLNGDTIFGGFSISNMVNFAESQGKNVLAVVNTDFFAQNTVPIGVVIEDGVYKSSPNDRNAVTFGYDGSVDIIEAPTVLITLYNNGGAEDADNAGKTTSFSHFNKQRSEFGRLLLLSEVFSTVSTRTSTPGWFVRFKILEGTPSVSGTMTLEVTETLTDDGSIPIGEGYLILTAADQSDCAYEFEKFAVGDIVTLTTTCSDKALENARYATGGGDILVSDGVKTDSGGWDSALMSMAPRTAFGVREDGSVIAYVIDGRNSEHSVGMTLDELADEMLSMECVYAVNFDGGGSTALSVRLPGDDKASVINWPSDGSERVCATYLLFVTDAAPNGEATNLSLRNDGLIVLAGSSAYLEYTATDKGYMPVGVPDDIEAEAANPEATINGLLYTAGSTAGIERVSLYSPATQAHGIGEIFVITRPTSMTTRIKGSTAPLTSIKLAPGTTFEFDVTATYYRRSVISQIASFEFTVTGDIGEITNPGVFQAGSAAPQTGSISISAGGRSIDIAVEIAGFSDMMNHWAREYAEYLQRKGISIGVTATEFGPSLPMKRCDYILMLYRAAGEPEVGVFKAFDDVPEDEYYSQALAWAGETGIAESIDGNFYPQLPLTRQDAFTFTFRALKIMDKLYVDGTAEDLAGFPDAGLLDDYAAIPTATLIALGVVEGMDGILSPDTTLTRAQMAKVLAVVLQLD